MKKIFITFLVCSLLSSCGVFLQKQGVKNYKIKEKNTQKGLNNYQSDFLYLNKLLEESFPEVDSIFPKDEREKQVQKIVSTLAVVDNYTDFGIQARKYLSNFKNQHTSISLKQGFKSVYPYVIYISSNDWYLLNLPTHYDSLLIGKRIVKFNGVSTKVVEDRLINFTFAENKISQQFEIRDLQLYNKPEYLKEIGVIKKNSDVIKLEFDDQSEIELSPISIGSDVDAFNISFKENSISKFQNESYSYSIHKDQKFGYLQFNRCHDKIDILDGIESYVKPWLQPLARGYVKRQFQKDNSSKRIANYYNPKYPVFKDFVWELIDSLNHHKIENLIIDLRNNPGGNITLGIQLMYFLTDKDTLQGFSEYAFTSDIYKKYFKKEYQDLEKKYPEGMPKRCLVKTDSDENLFFEIANSKSKYFIQKNRPLFKGNIYILSNNRTGSAASLLTTLFQDNDIGTVIGTSTGNNPIGATTYTPMELPNTKAKISIATTYLVRPKKGNGRIQIPDIWIEYTISDLINGKDPYLEIVVQKIKEKVSHK
ncbi:S41 family peptidase [Arundinibacter roseus]|uniref:Tail specific protease domain-containing protein n=1 Tax=Arundinibacter roseus TaxID=2070510 RepID=A0A4R4JU62_9BACT|nr:S41 family peptidase [Arundinibacter roseus]TDB58224.1 hypothetical protein EZE20_23180 [Arundinibacter roseus]